MMSYDERTWKQEKERVREDLAGLTDREKGVYTKAYSGLMKSMNDWGVFEMMEIPFRENLDSLDNID